jgi:hypothetical protein
MHVPPQESAPSLSPRQSFGCQSPLPLVTGTDRTESLRDLWQLQGSFQEFSSPSAHSHLKESLTGQQASRSPILRGHHNHGKHRQRLPQTGSTITYDLTVMFRNRAPRTG